MSIPRNLSVHAPNISAGGVLNVPGGGTGTTTSTGTGSVVLSANPTFTGTVNLSSLTASGAITGSDLTLSGSSGIEGGQINLAKAATSTTLAGTHIIVDVYGDKLRIFENGGTSRGVYIDLSAAAAGVTTNLVGTPGVTTGKAIAMAMIFG